MAKRAEIEVVVREYQQGDEDAILRSFNRIYGAIDPNFHPRTMEEWRWRYARNPAGWRIWLVFTEAGEVIAQQAGMPVVAVHEGRRVMWNQVGDTFIDPDYTRSLRNPGLFYRVAKPFSDTYGGAPPDCDPVLYGLPTRRALRIGQKQLGYEVVRNQNKLCVSPSAIQPGKGTGVDIEEVSEFELDVDDLFERYANEHTAITVRDARYLNWRYTQHPELSYSIALARRQTPGRELCGYAIYRQTAFDLREDGLICDLVAPSGEDAARAELLAWLASRARGDGVENLTAVQAETSRSSIELQRAGFRMQSTGYFNVGRCYAGPYDMRWLYHNWHYNIGDFDIC